MVWGLSEKKLMDKLFEQSLKAECEAKEQNRTERTVCTAITITIKDKETSEGRDEFSQGKS